MTKIVASKIPARLLRAPNLFEVGAILLGKAAANDNCHDDPPPCAAATVPASAEQEDGRDGRSIAMAYAAGLTSAR